MDLKSVLGKRAWLHTIINLDETMSAVAEVSSYRVRYPSWLGMYLYYLYTCFIRKVEDFTNKRREKMTKSSYLKEYNSSIRHSGIVQRRKGSWRLWPFRS